MSALDATIRREAELYHRAMELLRRTRLPHGQCQPRERRACTHCNAADELAAMLAEYKGRRIVAMTASSKEEEGCHGRL